MGQSYLGTILIGAVLIMVALTGIAYERRKYLNQLKQIDEKKEELLSIIADAEQMVEELNRFSDYIVTQMDDKNGEINAALKNIDDRIKCMTSLSFQGYDIDTITEAAAVNGNVSSRTNQVTEIKTQYKKNDKIIPISNRYKEVIQLAEKGLCEIEIAKKLNIGKGEIQLILDMYK